MFGPRGDLTAELLPKRFYEGSDWIVPETGNTFWSGNGAQTAAVATRCGPKKLQQCRNITKETIKKSLKSVRLLCQHGSKMIPKWINEYNKYMMYSRKGNFMKTIFLHKEKHIISSLEGPKIVQDHIKKHEKLESKKTCAEWRK